LAELAKKIEEHYGKAQDIEFAIDNDLPSPKNIFIVQSRPETVWSSKAPMLLNSKVSVIQTKTTERVVALKGLPASPGFHIGQAKVIISSEEAAKLMKQGDILVTRMTNPDWAPYMRIAGAIITDEGGMTCHAAIVSRELGIPCIVGTGNATKVLVNGNYYTVDARTGVVYEGVVEELRRPIEKTSLAMPVPSEQVLVTATKIYMNLGVPEKIEDYAHLPFDGIGLMRIEFIMTTYIGEHPLYLIESNQESKFIDKMAEGVARVARTIQPRPVVVRFSDFKTNEYAQLKGGEKYEPKEDNPMLGWRGVSRYISPQYEKAFRLECRAIKKCRDEWGLKNVWVMLPFVRTTWEVEKCLAILREEGLMRGRDFKVWLMAEVPSIIFMADEFSKLCDGFSIGSNDLTQLILGTDRDSQILPTLDSRYFDERDPAILRAIEHLIKVAHESKVTVSICGQAPSVYEDFTEAIVRLGIDSVSVNPDVVVQTRKLVASVEQKILLEGLRKVEK
ncbi:MAG: phosphoenolpyruvate synthase, partial [Nitrososphaerales archaeon]